jgi:hypothetical protein
MVAASLGGIPAAASAATRSVPAAQVSRSQSSRLATDGSITGVLRGLSGRSYSGTCVTASSRGHSVSSQIGSTGRYFLVGLRPGPYTVRVALCAAPSAPARIREGRAFVLSAGARVVVQPGRSITLTSASLHPVRLMMATSAQEQAMRLAAARLKAPGTISGVVRAPSGRPLAGICVAIWSIGPNSGEGFGVVTGRNGSYSVEPATAGLPTRGLRVEFSANALFCGNKGNYAPQWWKHAATEAKATTLTVRPGTHLKNIGATLTPGGEFSGVVRSTSKTGQPLRGICISPQPADFNQLTFTPPSMTFTAANGSYTVDDLATGKYAALAQPGGECGGNSLGNSDYLDTAYPHVLKIVAGKHVNGINFVMRLGAILTGTVQSGGLPVVGACVDLAENGLPSVQSSTGPGGSFLIQQLPPGRYQVAFTGGCGNTGSFAPQYYPGKVNAEQATTLTLTYGQTQSGINATLLPGATISGLVTSPQGKPLGQVCVAPASPQQLGPAPNALALVASLSFGGHTGSKGGYVITNLAPGSYYLLFTSCNLPTLATQLYAGPGQSAPTLVSAPAGAVTSGVDMVEPTGGTIAGVARNAFGHPVANICVAAVPSPLTALTMATASLTQDARNGTYSITGLAAGSYKVEFGPCIGGPYANTWYGGTSFFAAAKTVHVTAGRVTRGINGKLRSGQVITGRVTNGTTGAPLKNVCVTASDPQGIPYGFALTGPDGRYIVTELAPGTYTLQFGSCSVAVTVVSTGTAAGSAGPLFPAAGAPSDLAPAIRAGVKVTASRSTTGVNEVLKTGGHITGMVLGGTSPVAQPGVCVEATPVTGNGVAAAAATGPAGNYRLGPLAAGTYRLLFTTACSVGTAALAPLQYSTVVTVKPPQTTSAVDATLASDGQITGTATNQSSAGLAGVCVIAQPQAGGGSPVEAITGTGGTYTIPLLAPGSYTVEFSSGCGAKGYLTQWWNDVTSAASATPVPVTAGGTASGINATLST